MEINKTSKTIYFILDEWSTTARVCRCNNGQMSCTYPSFTRNRCTVYGDPHVIPFYGSHYNFMGRSSYILLKTDKIDVEAYLYGCPSK